MKRISLLILFVGFFVSANAQRVVGYIPQYRTTTYMDDHIEWDMMTDAYYFGAIPTSTGGVTIEQSARFDHVKLRASQNSLNVWLSIGGWGKSANFPPTASTATNRQNFANELVSLCATHGLTGIDLDWEFPTSAQKGDMKLLLQTIRQTFDANGNGYKLSAACGAEQAHADNWDSGSFQYLDYLNIMTYDGPSGNHASLQFMKDAMDIFNNAGCPYSKMLGGAAFYSRPTVKMFNEIIAASPNQTTFETDGTGSQLYNGKTTLEAKMEYVVDTKGGAGILIWEVTQGVKGQYSLLKVLYDKAQEYACPVPHPDLGADVSICGTSSLLLNGNVTGAYTYSWKKNGSPISGSSSIKTVTSAGTYEISVSDGSCAWTDEIEVLGVLPTVALGADFDLCSPSVMTLDAAVTGAGLSYAWTKNNTAISGATNSTLEVTKAGTYKVVVSASGCTATNDEVVVTSSLVDVNDETSCGTGTVTFTVNNPGSFDHKWYTTLTGGTSLATTNSYTTPSNSSTTFYYVEKYDPSGGACNGMGAWNAATTYTGDPAGTPQLTYNGKLYKRISWWSQNNLPDEASSIHFEETAVCGSNCDRTKVTAIIDNGCASSPTLSVSANQNNVCEGVNIIFTATPTDAGATPTLVWKVNGVQKQSSTSLTYSSSTLTNSAVVEVSLLSNGTVKDDVTMTIKTLPTVTASATSTSVCAGETVTLTGGGAMSYTWNNGATNGIAFAPSTTKTYTVTGTTNGCSNTATKVVTVKTLPTVTASATSTSICAGETVILTGGGAMSYAWNNGATNGIAFTPSTTKTYTVTGTTNGCSNTATKVVTVKTLPTVTASATSTSICAGETVILTGGGATSYTWNNGATNGIAFTPSTTKTYTVTGTTNGCSNTATKVVTVKTLPTVTASATSTSICAGETVILTGGGATSYTWNNGATNGIAFTPSTTKTYTVTGTTNGCSNTATKVVTVKTLPTVTASATSTSICAGETVILTGGGATSYTWNNGATNGIAFTPSTTKTYTVTGTTNGCSNTATKVVTVKTLPTVTASATSTSICAGETVTLTGGGAMSYAWNNGATNGIAFTPSTTKTYTVTGTTNGCSNTATKVVTVKTLPTVTASATSTSICAGETVILTGGGAMSYAWNNGATNGIAFAPSTTKTYTVTGTTNGCSNTATKVVTVKTLPTVTASATSTSICAGETVILTGGGAMSYAWNNGATNGIAFTPSTTKTYTVTGTTNGCSNTATKMVTVKTIPTVTASATSTSICAGENCNINRRRSYFLYLE